MPHVSRFSRHRSFRRQRLTFSSQLDGNPRHSAGIPLPLFSRKRKKLKVKTSVLKPKLASVRILHANSDSPQSRKPPARHPNTKRIGELAEAAFVVKAAGLGFAVSKPWGDSERYDFILDSGPRTWRVQIKCTESPNNRGYQVQSTYTDRKQKGHYTPADIDVLVAYILPLDLWYVIPAQAFPASASIRFYPEGNISRRARFEQYREAWHFFQEQPPQADPSNADPPLDTCHPERSECSAKRGTHGVEGPLPSPEQPAAPQSPMERMMTQWAQRVAALYNRKR